MGVGVSEKRQNEFIEDKNCMLKSIFFIFAENDIIEVYHEANFVTLNFRTPVTLYTLSPSPGSPASC